jgi:hypothetical protein
VRREDRVRFYTSNNMYMHCITGPPLHNEHEIRETRHVGMASNPNNIISIRVVSAAVSLATILLASSFAKKYTLAANEDW